MAYKKFVQCNYHDIVMAVKEAVVPMQKNIDRRHHIPYFINTLVDGKFENSHHPSYSAAHIPGRWLMALYGAKEVLGIEVEEEVVETLAYSTYYVFDDATGLPRCLDLENMKPVMRADLHNLREYMHALYALMRYRSDERAYEIAMRLMRTVDQYFDSERNTWDGERFERDTGCSTYIAPIKGLDDQKYYFPSSFGRYIEPLVKLYKYCGVNEALVQAVKLKECALKYVLDENGSYRPDIMGGHTHSVTSMISSLALLAKTTDDYNIIRRIRAFLDNGLKEIMLESGWCIENYYKDYLGGETNNTSDLVRTYMVMGEMEGKEYFCKAERMIRGHILPAQLLDLDLMEDGSPCICEGPFMKGTFGFPCPYGHQEIPGRLICYNWDIVGGTVDGLCEAIRHIAVKKDNRIDVNMLFDYRNEYIQISDPYTHHGLLEITRLEEKDSIIRVNLSDNLMVEHIAGVDGNGYLLDKNLLYLFGDCRNVKVKVDRKKMEKSYYFRGKRIKYKWEGDSITAANNGERRLCFFKDLE